MARSITTTIETQGSMIHKIRLGRHSNKTRVVIDLAAGGEFNFDQQFDENNNILTIQLFPADFPEKEKVVAKEVIAAKPVVEAKPTEPVQEVTEVVEIEEIEEIKETAEVVEQETAEHVATTPAPVEEEGPVVDPLLLDVTFENTSNKGEMVLFKLNGFYPPSVTGEEEGTPLVICDFAGTRLDEKITRTQAIHGEYIEQVTIQQPEDSDLVRVIIELVPNKNYDLQQVFFQRR